MTVTPIHPERPGATSFDRPPGGFDNVDQRHPNRVVIAVEALVLAAVGVADFVQFRQVVEAVFVTTGERLATAFALGATVGTTALMAKAGSTWRRYRARESHPPYAANSLLYLAWVSSGIFFGLLRWSQEAIVYPDDTLLMHLMPSLAFLTLFMLSGALAWHLGYEVTNPRASAFRRSERAVRKAEKRVANATRELRAGIEERHRLQGGVERDQQRHSSAVAQRQAQAAELKALARELMAESEQDPPSTVVITERF